MPEGIEIHFWWNWNFFDLGPKNSDFQNQACDDDDLVRLQSQILYFWIENQFQKHFHCSI